VLSRTGTWIVLRGACLIDDGARRSQSSPNLPIRPASTRS